MQENNDSPHENTQISSQKEQKPEEGVDEVSTNRKTDDQTIESINSDSNEGQDSPIVQSVQIEARHLENEFQKKIIQAMVQSRRRQMTDKDKLLPPERAQRIATEIQEIEEQIENTMHRLKESQKQQLDLLSRVEDMERLILKRERFKVVKSVVSWSQEHFPGSVSAEMSHAERPFRETRVAEDDPGENNMSNSNSKEKGWSPLEFPESYKSQQTPTINPQKEAA